MKRIFLKLSLLLLAFALPAESEAQLTIGANAAPDSSAMLDVRASNKGVLAPRLNLTNTAAWGLAGTIPQESMIVYNTNAALAGAGANGKGFYYWSGSNWVWLSGLQIKPWSVPGNTSTDTTLNFIGNTDNVPLVFRINNTRSGIIMQSNMAFGYRALMGYTAPYPSSGIENTAVGTNTLVVNSGSSDNVAVGYAVLNVVTSAAGTAAGALAMAKTKTGDRNAGLGYGILNNNVAGARNIAIGISAMLADSTGSDNVSAGCLSLSGNKQGNWSVALGPKALQAATGSVNIGIGSNAGSNITTGHNNTVIGSAADSAAVAIETSAPSASYEMNIGNTLFGTNADTTIGLGKIGVNTRTPATTLQVNGSLSVGIRVIDTGSIYTVAADDYYIVGNTGAALGITLPSAALNKGREIVLRRSGTSGSTLTVNAAVGDGIDAFAASVTSVSGENIYRLVSDGNVTWRRID
jgi:hypothetical protein